MYVVGPKELLLDDHKVCIQGTHQFISKVGSFFFPGAPMIYNRYYRYFGSTQTKKKKTKVTSQNLLLRYIQIFGKVSVVSLIYISLPRDIDLRCTTTKKS